MYWPNLSKKIHDHYHNTTPPKLSGFIPRVRQSTSRPISKKSASTPVLSPAIVLSKRFYSAVSLLQHNTEARQAAYIECGEVNASRGRMSLEPMRQFKLGWMLPLSPIYVCWYLKHCSVATYIVMGTIASPNIFGVFRLVGSRSGRLHMATMILLRRMKCVTCFRVPPALLMVLCMIDVDSRNRSEILTEWFEAEMTDTEWLSHGWTALMWLVFKKGSSTYLRKIAEIQSSTNLIRFCRRGKRSEVRHARIYV